MAVVPPNLKIVRVLKVEDTRQYEEGPDDRWHPIPGSGNVRCCDRCGREHEVHAYVEMADGSQSIVGTGCSSAVDLAVATQFKTLGSMAKRLKMLDAQEAAHNAAVAAWEKARREVDALPLPPIQIERLETRIVFCVGVEGRAWAQPWAERDLRERKEREQCAIEGWKEARMKERGQPRFCPHPKTEFKRRRFAIEKAIKKTVALVSPVTAPTTF